MELTVGITGASGTIYAHRTLVHLENMLKLARAGAQILPASPAFYHRPQSIEEMVAHLVFRILDQFGIPHSQRTRWRGAVEQLSEAVETKGD